MPPLTAIVAQPGITNVQSTADQYRYNGEMPPDQALEEQALNRRQQIANLLIQQGLGQAGANHGQMVGRFYVPGSPVQNLAGLASIAAGAYGTYKGDQARAALGEQTKQATADAVRDYVEKTRGTPERTLPEGTAGPVNPAIPPDPNAARMAIANAMASRSPGLSNMAQMDFAQMNKPPLVVNTGGGTALLDPTTGQQKTMIPHTVTPDAQAAIDQKNKELATIPASKIAELGVQAQTHGTPSGTAILEDQTKRDLFPQVSGNAAAAAAAQGGIALQAHQDRALQMAQNQRQDDAMLELRKSQGLSDQEYKKERLAMDQKHNDQTAQLAREKLAIDKQVHEGSKLQPGYRWTDATHTAQEVIPGSGADMKKEGVYNSDQAMLSTSNAAFDRLESAASELLNHPGLAGITGLRGAIPNIPGTAAADAQAKLDTLKSQVFLGAMQEMRANSKTGSTGLGNQSDSEGKRLETSKAALANAQSLDQMKESLRKIMADSQGAKDRMREIFNQKHKDRLESVPSKTAPAPSAGPAKITSDAEYNALPSGTVFIAPDGKQRKKP